jgi:uncharacterized damage-inducible protein DinB
VNEVKRIEDQLNRAFLGDAWYGDSLTEILAGVSAEKAVAHPVSNVHSILEIILHLTFTQDVMRQRIEGEDVIINGAEDLFFVETASEAEWKEAVEMLEISHQQLRKVIHNLSEADLHRTIVNQNHTVYFLLEGLIQHLTYHAGQIAILKKAYSIQ